MVKENLIYLPLGGSGEVGMNMYVYGYGEPGLERFIIVDLGVTFPDMETSPGVNLIFPDISWIVEIFPKVSDLPSPSRTLIITGPFFFPYILVVITGPNKPLCHASFTRGAPPAFANTLH